MDEKKLLPTEDIYSEIRKTILEARQHVYIAVNSAMVQTYWNIGRIIVEHEQEGKERAEYGTGLLKNLAQRLTDEFGRGFTERNLRNMRTFYQKFPKWHTVCAELSWSHYRLLLKVEKEPSRMFYMEECAKTACKREIHPISLLQVDLTC